MNTRPITVVIMAGGKATRLEGNRHRDKVMVEIGNHPLLDYQVHHYLRHSLVRTVVIATVGRLDIVEHFRSLTPRVVVWNEASAHGTGGDLLRTVQGLWVATLQTLVVNGDTVLDLDLERMFHRHQQHRKECTIALTSASGIGVQNVGAFHVDRRTNAILRTGEAASELGTLVPAGTVYEAFSSTGAILYDTRYLQYHPWNRSGLICETVIGPEMSAERHLIPELVQKGQAVMFDNGLRVMIDNGTPERMTFLLRLGSWLLRTLLGPPERIRTE
ncbi:MAG: NTP transferase domain-containing protein [Candidatus Uhrbacteria bacterium]|nr:NTP transferase domain-containing protein [Candidatus Uhrbacteria bacterium]